MRIKRRGKVIVGVAMSIVAMMCLFPPFYRDFVPKFRDATRDYSAFDGYHFITKSDAEMAMLWQLRIDIERLLVQILFVAFVAGTVLFISDWLIDDDDMHDDCDIDVLA